MALNNQSYGESFLRNHFRTEMEDREEGRLLKAFRDEWSQAIDMSQVNSINRPSTAQILATLSARGIDASKLDTLTHIGRGIYIVYPKSKEYILPRGNFEIGDVVAKVTTPPPITKMLERKTIDVYVTKFPYEIPLSAFREGFEQRLGITTLNIRKETYKTMPGINTGKIIVKIDARDAAKIPEFLKVCGLPIQTWFYGCMQVRPCSNCGQAGHDKWKCVQLRKNTQTDITSITHTNIQTQRNKEMSHSYAGAVKAKHVIPREPASGEVTALEISSGEIEPTLPDDTNSLEKNNTDDVAVFNRFQVLETEENGDDLKADEREERELEEEIEITPNRESTIEMMEVARTPKKVSKNKRKAISPKQNEGKRRAHKEKGEEELEEPMQDTPDTAAIKKILKEMTTVSIKNTLRCNEESQEITKPTKKLTKRKTTKNIEENTNVAGRKENGKRKEEKTADNHETKITPIEKADENEFVTPPSSPKKKQEKTKATGKKGLSAHNNTATQLQDKNTDTQTQQQNNNTRKGDETQQ